ncbi:glycosyltransferase family 2 protein [Desulfogranum mediterraneum]|uniref:glycosyltransferase family 2 protein n=1 Tax=Desulfogranum mediterraneum TaxID=160661 RepID=UPI0003F73B5C|nr:glycosyltransferase family 2 protein [Desulfogranum mediterraneum]
MGWLELVFFALLFFSFYSYVFFPLSLALLTRVFSRAWKRAEGEPLVTVIISAYNEEKDIKGKVENTLALDYPEDKLSIVVSSDGSTDRTDEIVQGMSDRRLLLRSFSGRIGKTACLNRVIEEFEGELVVFTDANSMFSPGVLRQLVSNFNDPEIGAVSGWTKYCNSASGEETTGLYARIERQVKVAESSVASCVGADGAIFAIRKELYRPLRSDDINDFVVPLNVVKQGYRVVLDEKVFCLEEATEGVGNIYKRQVRITTRTAWALWRHLGLLNVFRYGFFSYFLISHKILRLLTPFFLLAVFVVNLMLLSRSPLYLVPLSAQLLLLVTAMAAFSGTLVGTAPSVCKYFLITFLAQAVGCLRMVFGQRDVVWTPKR